jgi:hypothetical protein
MLSAEQNPGAQVTVCGRSVVPLLGANGCCPGYDATITLSPGANHVLGSVIVVLQVLREQTPDVSAAIALLLLFVSVNVIGPPLPLSGSTADTVAVSVTFPDESTLVTSTVVVVLIGVAA